MKHIFYLTLLTMFSSNMVFGQLNGFAPFGKTNLDTAKTNKPLIPEKFILSGIGSLNDLPDSVESGASLNVFGEFRFLDIKTHGDTSKNALKLHMNFGLNRTFESLDRDSVRLARVAFQEGSNESFSMGASMDLMPFFSNRWSTMNPKKLGDGDFEYMTLEPTLDYTYSRWSLRSPTSTDSSDLRSNSLFEVNRIQSSQFNLGIRYWYVLHKGDNTFGFMVYPHMRSLTVTDATYGTFQDLFDEASMDDRIQQNLIFYGATLALQLNTVQFSFQWNELFRESSIIDPNVSGGVFQLKVSLKSDFLSFK